MRFENLALWLSWLGQLHPRNIELGLDRVRQVWQRMGAPKIANKLIVVGGTNGKGSTVALFESILVAAGYRVGAYSSPHICRFNERIRIDLSSVDDESLLEAFQRVDLARREITLTYFEFTTLAAFRCFADRNLDVAVLEVGLGGRLDAVNIVDADLVVLTNVALDHQDWLGDDRESIGFEKAGILRAASPAIFAETDIPATVLARAAEIEADLTLVGRDYFCQSNEKTWDFRSKKIDFLALPKPALFGAVQVNNAAGVIAGLACLAQALPIERPAIEKGLQSVQLAGRFEVLSLASGATLVMDVAHNPAAAANLSANLKALDIVGKTHLVLAMLKTKDVANFIKTLAPQIDVWHFAELEHGQGHAAEVLQQALTPLEPKAKVACYSRVSQALMQALHDCSTGDCLVIAGSFHTVEAARNFFAVKPEFFMQNR